MLRISLLTACLTLSTACIFSGGNSDGTSSTDDDTDGVECAGERDCEGDDAGECSDGIDNDQNGDVDCDDARCADSDACQHPTLDEFDEEILNLSCDFIVECFEFYASRQECIDDQDESLQCTDYNAEAAADCLVDFAAAIEECPEDGEEFINPTSCEDVCLAE